MNEFTVSPYFEFDPASPPATPQELSGEIQGFYAANVKEHSQTYVTAPAKHYMLIARSRGQASCAVVGFAYFYNIEAAGHWEMWAVGVDEGWRRRGVASELVRCALLAARSMGANRFVFRWADQGKEHGAPMARFIDGFLANCMPGSLVSHDGATSWKRLSSTSPDSLPCPIGESWTIKLGTHAPYPLVHLKRRYFDRTDYEVVEVDPCRLLALHDRDQMRIPNPEHWAPEKRAGLQQFLDPKDPYPAEMPIVSVWDAPKPGWWARLHQQTWPAISFTNGRHRARLLRHFGAKRLPVEVHITAASRLVELCGTP